ncbi:hypothetical protein E5675_07250 [Sphingopyxis sp. PAMC25046]|nr:hypothetical protein E5675_07250 [Sphingopyxis sp. PAMC25046]
MLTASDHPAVRHRARGARIDGGIMIGGHILGRISEAHFRASRRWIVTIIGATFLYQAIWIAAA